MKLLKFGVLLSGLAGAIGILFLPLIVIHGQKIFVMDVPVHGPIVLGAFVLPTILAALCVFLFKGTPRWAMVVSLIAFTIAGIKVVDGDGDSGQTVAMFAAFIGMVISLILTIKPETLRPAPGRAMTQGGSTGV